jgi:hypothetical protein
MGAIIVRAGLPPALGQISCFAGCTSRQHETRLSSRGCSRVSHINPEALDVDCFERREIRRSKDESRDVRLSIETLVDMLHTSRLYRPQCHLVDVDVDARRRL